MSPSQDYQQDLASVRNLMERSVKFISLSGLSGVLAGIYALAGATVAYYLINSQNAPYTAANYRQNPGLIISLALVAGAVLLLSLLTGWYLSYQKAKKSSTSFWNDTARRLVFNLMIPLATGGVFILILLYRGYFGMIAPSFLLFYGLALVNASSNLYDEVRYLGYIEVVLGLVAALLPGYGLLFWAIGFGVLHVFYGALMYRKYDRA
jgi:hypothetical protein